MLSRKVRQYLMSPAESAAAVPDTLPLVRMTLSFSLFPSPLPLYHSIPNPLVSELHLRIGATALLMCGGWDIVEL